MAALTLSAFSMSVWTLDGTCRGRDTAHDATLCY